MRDQVVGLQQKGINANQLNEKTSVEAIKEVRHRHRVCC